MYGQSILTCAGGLGSTGINGADGPSSAGTTCGGGGGMGYFQSNLAGMGGSGTFPGSNSTIYEVDDPSSESGNGGLNNLGQALLTSSKSLQLAADKSKLYFLITASEQAALQCLWITSAWVLEVLTTTNGAVLALVVASTIVAKKASGLS